MSEYGLKIKNIEAGSIFECNTGVRNELDMTDAMLTNSLFLDFLLNNGLNVWKEESTRDVITIEFNYGSRSFEQEEKHVRGLIEKTDPSDENRLERLNKLYSFVLDNKDKYVKKSNQELRTMFYVNGVEVTYNTHNKSGQIIKSETILYRMLYRTPGKAKKGVCTFICDRLYKKAREFLYMGIELPYENAKIVEIGAYASLITSSVVGRIKIPPERILVLNDFDSFFTTNVVSVETNENNECVAVRKDNYELKNTMFDGQALIDASIFPTWGDGYVLLRHHMCKMAAFNTNIQRFFVDWCREHNLDYMEFKVNDMFGKEHYAKDILLITTDNAMKWLKFGVSYDYWSERVRENDSLFGVVKTSHQSKLGNVQRMSYQMVNALDINTMDESMRVTADYLRKLQTNDEVFLEYLKKNINFSNDFEVLLALVNQDPDFIRSEYFRQRKKKIIETYILNMKSGKLIQNADNLTIVGSPYAMLLHSVGVSPEEDDTFEVEDDCIQCFTDRFDYDEYLAAFRNPFNSRNNMGYLHNHYHPFFHRYFNLGKQIVAVNMVHTDFQDRNNGSDQDSDSIYTTNHSSIVNHARHCYMSYPTIVNNIQKEQNHYKNTLEDYAAIDNKLAKAQLAIGESSNLAQLCLTYTYTFDDRKYDDYVCILSVLAQCAIDNAKRTFSIDLPREIKRIKKDMDIGRNLYPYFWTIIKPEFKSVRETKNGKVHMINKGLKCPMNELYQFKAERHVDQTSTLPMSTFFVNYELKEKIRKCKRIEEFIQKYSFKLYGYNIDDENNMEEYLLLREDFDKLIEDIRSIHISNNYLGLMSWLLNRAFMITPNIQSNNGKIRTVLNKNKSLLVKTLYEISPVQFLQCLSKNCRPSKN